MEPAPRRSIPSLLALPLFLISLSHGWAFEGDIAPLMHAAYRGDLEAMSRLIQQGADVNEANLAGMTALDFAAGATPIVNQVYRGSPDAVKLLLKHGANPNLAGN